jgi:hypothetical protein
MPSANVISLKLSGTTRSSSNSTQRRLRWHRRGRSRCTEAAVAYTVCTDLRFCIARSSSSPWGQAGKSFARSVTRALPVPGGDRQRAFCLCSDDKGDRLLSIPFRKRPCSLQRPSSVRRWDFVYPNATRKARKQTFGECFHRSTAWQKQTPRAAGCPAARGADRAGLSQAPLSERLRPRPLIRQRQTAPPRHGWRGRTPGRRGAGL